MKRAKYQRETVEGKQVKQDEKREMTDIEEDGRRSGRKSERERAKSVGERKRERDEERSSGYVKEERRRQATLREPGGRQPLSQSTP